ncbi:MAG: sorbosone dehydrogenase family protein [Nevskia sp.]|nr:sorbosone dehydrogenase family protein [Nevskia sp.]
MSFPCHPQSRHPRSRSIGHAAVTAGLATILLAACGADSRQSASAGYGAYPDLPAPTSTLLPTVNIAPAKDWPAGQTPRAAPGLKVSAFASGLDHPRWLLVLPNGDVLVAESNAPVRPDDATGIRGWVMGKVMSKAGAGTPSADRISLLRDADGDGVAETRSALLTGLHSPFGMALVGNQLFVADTDAVLRFPYVSGVTNIDRASGSVVTALPAGPINHHWTKNLIANADGSKLYVTVGSNSNVAENGMPAEEERAAILEVDIASGSRRVFASGLRNPNGLAWQPESGALWTAVNERDEIGNDLVPDYMTSVVDGGFYGWPYSYYGNHLDERVQPQKPELVATARVPDYALGAHTASLGLAASNGTQVAGALSPAFGSGMFIGQHGSWNRKPLSGYRVIFVPFTKGKPAGTPTNVLDGFIDPNGKALGRPVGVAIDNRGALLVADDVGNSIWRVSTAP